MMKRMICYMVLMMSPFVMLAQNDRETIKKSFEVKDKSQEMWLCVCNIEGDVEVEAYDGNTIEIEVQKRIRARREDDIAKGMEDVQVDFVEGDGFVRARLSTSQNVFTERADPLSCGWNWNRHAEKVYYRFRLDFKVKVPREISVKISTVNDSNLSITGVEGQVYANNVNGDVELIGIGNDTKAHTVNGRIDVEYVRMPKEFAEFETVNGDILVVAPKDAGAIFSFESKQGDIFSDFDFSERVAAKVVSNKEGKGGTKYKIANANSYKVKNGGPEMAFKTLNGNIRVKKGN